MPIDPEKLELILRTLPETPGVYQYFDREGKIIYVGKAKNLKRRVSSYFNRTPDNAKTRVMVGKIDSVKFIVVDSETDSLLLENNLIKKYRPRYNVLLKDDKTYPWIVVKNEPYPRIFLTRRKINDGSEYFGPYPSLRTARLLLDLIKGLFPLRTCNFDLSEKNIASGKYKICLEYHIKNCAGPCENLVSREEYEDAVRAAVNVIKGNFSNVLAQWKKQMAREAAALRFEKAHLLKEKIGILEDYQAKSTVIGQSSGDMDIFSIVSDSEYGYVNYMKIYKGAVIQSHTLEIKKRLDEPDSELLELGIPELRSMFNSASKEVYVPFPVDINLGESVRLIVPRKGDKRRLIELSEKNAKFARTERFKQEKITDPERHTARIMATMKQDLQLDREPRHIECFDNSNTQGTNPVSSCVVFRNGKPSKKDYRHFKVRTVVGPDDFATMEEVIHRRYGRMLRENEPLPDLIVADGGKGQLSAVYGAMKELGIEDKVAVIGIAKRLEEIFFPEDPVPLYLDKRSETLRIIQQLRDEAHRFGITHHRKLRSKSALVSELDGVEGIGPKTEEILMRHFKSVKRLREASSGELAGVVGPVKAALIREHFDAQKS